MISSAAAGLNLRTIQRIENVGTASLQSLKAIASALEADIEDLIRSETMDRYEYKTIVMPFRLGLFKQGLPDIQDILNRESEEGWRFRQIIMPSSSLGSSDNLVAVLERRVQ